MLASNHIPNCLFCKIIDKRSSAKIILENENFIAFDDNNKQAPTHVLILPKEHYSSLKDLTETNINIIAGMTLMANKVARLKGIDAGYRLIMNSGLDAGQTIFHIHMHLLGGRKLEWPPG